MQLLRSVSVAKIANRSAIETNCTNCRLRASCLPRDLLGDDVSVFDRIIRHSRLLKRHQPLYRLGDPLTSIYAVLTGTFKSTKLMQDGRVHIVDFYLPGELLGMDAINGNKHPCSAEALEPSSVCEIPFAALERLSRTLPDLQYQLLRIMSRQIRRNEHALTMLGSMSAEERVASCLLSLSDRYAGPEFRLSMSRQELADYLGLALETVSRLFTRFQTLGLIEIRRRVVRLRDIARLSALANGEHPTSTHAGRFSP